MSKIPSGITVLYFNDKEKNIYAELPLDNEQAKRLSQRIYKNAMTVLAEKKTDEPSTHRG
ncbi:MAG: hypothetical protein OSJ83_06215 [Clostridia bacterium]|nr:hypothetical protein [Clostridia bacterium]